MIYQRFVGGGGLKKKSIFDAPSTLGDDVASAE
jgi:hypothetical protein